MSFVLILPAVGLQFIDLIGRSDDLYWIPIFNVLLLMDDVVKGNAEPAAIGITWLVMVAALVAVLVFAHRTFQRDDVIFRS